MALLSAIRSGAALTYEEAFGAKDITSEQMTRTTKACFELYYDDIDNKDLDSAQRIPVVIVDSFEKTTFAEYDVSTDEDFDNEVMAKTLESIENIRKEAFQFTLIGGEGFIKPILKKGQFVFVYIKRPNVYVFGRDEQGNVNDIGLIEKTSAEESGRTYYYKLLERRTVDNEGYLEITYALYRADSDKELGTKVPLNRLGKYSNLREYISFPIPLDGLGLVPIKTPITNCVDGSKDGVPIYAPAIKEIQKLYKHEKRIDNEYELTEPHLVTSVDVQRRDEKGRLIEIPKYITAAIDDNIKEVGMTLYNPAPNQTQLESRENQIKRNIEDLINMYRGFLSNVENMDRTATEVETSMAKAANTISALQGMWAPVITDTLSLCSKLAKLHNLPWPGKEPEITISWGNGILYDEEQEYNRLNGQVSQGNLRPEYLLEWLEIHPLDEQRIEELRKLMPGLSDTNDYEDEGNDG